MDEPTRLAVFVSGRGSNLQALLDHFNGRASTIARVALVVGSSPNIEALDRARRAGVPTYVPSRGSIADAVADELLDVLTGAAIEVVVLAGYIRLVPAEVVRHFEGRMLNIHPALLPAFGGAGMYGDRVHRAVLESGARVSGASVHLVTERYDEGRIIAQWPVPVFPADTPDSLAARVLKVEHMLLPAAVEMLLRPGDGGAGDGAFELTDAPAPPEYNLRDFLNPQTEV